MYRRGLKKILIQMLRGGIGGSLLGSVLAFLLAGPNAMINGALFGCAFGLMGAASSLLGFFYSDDPEDEKPMRGAHPYD